MTGRLLSMLSLTLLILLISGCQESDTEAEPTSLAEDEISLTSIPPLSGLLGTPGPEAGRLPALSADEIAIGQVVYAEHCAECHGEDLEGEQDWQEQNEDDSFRSPPHNSNGHTWHHGDKALLESIRLGGERLPDNIGGFSEMPAFKDTLSDEEMVAVLTFIKSTWPDDIRLMQWEQTVQEQN
jgi:mono/diheme cytochrome c family protein